MKLIDLTGTVFGKLTVLKRNGTKNIQPMWECKCECGKIKLVSGLNLKIGNTKSCGCLRKKGGFRSHGLSKTPEYKTWKTMKYRCMPQYFLHKDYYDRGIYVCKRWLHSFENFLEDMGKKPTTKHSLDRFPNNDGIYEPTNCRWATPKEQCRNKRDNRIISYNGESKTVAEWSDIFKARGSCVLAMLKYKPFEAVYNFYMLENYICPISKISRSARSIDK